ncbi:hypothetical protein DSB67_24885 [Vibrio campbellii]|uniref:imm11 family protein n=1 Tax=Vibrio campbellii TaxID=680 RepID=UPI00026C49A3|nr:DUF1629 domain-containing protein [Vibrio campbellii]AXB34564.1 hypothetical protein DSB67_24885 [Vibrio campbellii]
MKYDDEYYLLMEDARSGPYMLKQSKNSDAGLDLLFQRSIKREVFDRGHVQITWGDDGKFSPCDYHGLLPSGLVSDKFKKVLDSFNLRGVDFYETDLEHKGQVWADRYLVHIWQNYRALHQGRTKIDGTFLRDRFTLESMSLDERVLDKVVLEDRLAFRLNEKPEYLYHETVVAALKAANVTGVRYVKVKDWGISSVFDSQEEEDEFYDDL